MVVRTASSSSQAYLERRGNRLRQHDFATEQMDEAIKGLSEAATLEALDRYIPTLEKVVAEHKRDSVDDHNLTLQHTRETPTLEANLARYRDLRSSLLDQGYRATRVTSWEQQKHESTERTALKKKILISGGISFVLGFMLLFFGAWQIGLVLMLVGAVCRLASDAIADLIRSMS
jgi:hypothetical protein